MLIKTKSNILSDYNTVKSSSVSHWQKQNKTPDYRVGDDSGFITMSDTVIRFMSAWHLCLCFLKHPPTEPRSQQSSACRRPDSSHLQTTGQPAGGPALHLTAQTQAASFVNVCVCVFIIHYKHFKDRSMGMSSRLSFEWILILLQKCDTEMKSDRRCKHEHPNRRVCWLILTYRPCAVDDGSDSRQSSGVAFQALVGPLRSKVRKEREWWERRLCKLC